MTLWEWERPTDSCINISNPSGTFWAGGSYALLRSLSELRLYAFEEFLRRHWNTNSFHANAPLENKFPACRRWLGSGSLRTEMQEPCGRHTPPACGKDSRSVEKGIRGGCGILWIIPVTRTKKEKKMPKSSLAQKFLEQ